MDNDINGNRQDINPNFELGGSSNFSFWEMIKIIQNGKWWIILCTFLSLTIGTYLVYSETPTYSSTVTIMIDDKTNAENKLFSLTSNDQSTIQNQIEILSSRFLAEKVVEELWASKYRNYLYTFGTRKFKPRGQKIRRPIKRVLSLGTWTPEDSKPSKFNMDFSEEIGQKFSGTIKSRRSIKHRKGTNIIEISFRSPDGKESALIANTIARVYKRLDERWSSIQSEGLEAFLDEQIKKKKNELEVYEVQLKDFKQTNKIFGLDQNASMLLQKLVDIESNYEQNQVEININKEQINFITNKLSDNEKTLANQLINSINSKLFALKNEIDDREAELIKNSSTYGESHEAVQQTKSKINNLKKELNLQTQDLLDEGFVLSDPIKYRQDLIKEVVSLESINNNLISKSKELNKLIENYNLKLKKLPDKELKYARLERDFSVLAETYKTMRQRQEEARISTAAVSGKVRIIDEALSSSSPSSPNVSKSIIVSLVFGFVFGSILVYLKESLDNTVKSMEFIDKLNLPILAIIPAIGQKYQSRNRKNRRKSKKNTFDQVEENNIKNVDKLQRRLIMNEDPKSPIAESYRSLRTSLQYADIDENHKTIMVSSPGPGEGKSTTIMNLAITYANLGKKTVLVDTDLRKPVVHKVFECEKDIGVSHYLSGKITDVTKIAKNTDINNLDVITCGVVPPNPSELLSSDKFKNLIADLDREYDIILFDAPPILAVTDSVILSQYMKNFIMVTRVGVTDKNGLRRALTTMSQVNSKITGVVMNALDITSSYYSGNYYNYYYYYHYYGTDK